ncbi:MAG: hypothetical protein M3132_00290 [Actinomycetia bacterium]|nr:hypothetical protein [Actinomycetes bacterium]
MWKRFTTFFALGTAILLVAAACSTPTSEGEALQPTGDPAPATADATADDDHVEDGDDSGEAAPAADVDRVVEVDLTEFAIAADLTFEPGETIEFSVTNSGVAPHEFRISNQARIDEHVGGGHDAHDEGSMSDDEMTTMDDAAETEDHDEAGAEGEGHDEVEAEDVFIELGAGESGSFVFTFPENTDDYTVGACLVPGHYEAGMFTGLGYNA